MGPRQRERVLVVGAGPVGCLAAIGAAERGAEVELWEKRADLRRGGEDAERSINLVLTERGLRALGEVGLRDRVMSELTVPVLGRVMHDLEGETTYQPYGKDETERNHSVERSGLNRALLDRAERAGVALRFERALDAIDLSDMAQIAAGSSDGAGWRGEALIAADGAGSRARALLVERGLIDEQVDLLGHGYKEIDLPARPDGSYALDERALHIWPRGDQMLMALANRDGSMTGTIYMDAERLGALSGEERAAGALFAQLYPDAALIAPEHARQLARRPLGKLGTVRCAPWHVDNRVLLIGDASHAIVPFFGQGLNAGFEDCRLLWERPGALGGGPKARAEAFAAFYADRKPDADAIARMAMDNFIEMRDRVGDDAFLRQKAIEHRLERALAPAYRSRYAIVMYSHLPYRHALRIGELQREVLGELAHDPSTRGDKPDLALARSLIDERIAPYLREHALDLSF